MAARQRKMGLHETLALSKSPSSKTSRQAPALRPEIKKTRVAETEDFIAEIIFPRGKQNQTCGIASV